MSRSNDDSRAPSPVLLYWEWKGTHENGRFERYQKSEVEGEKGEKISVKKASFMVLDQTSTVTGFNEDTSESIYANDVHSIHDDLKVYMGKNLLCEGKWADIKDKVKVNGGKFAKNIYALGKLPEDIGGEATSGVVRYTFAGSALRPWFEFAESNKVTDGVIIWDGTTIEGKKGSVKFESPVFKKQESGENEEKKAIEADKLLQEWFKSRAKAQEAYESEQAADPEPEMATAGGPVEDDDIPF
jgi:hypothetical protein